MFAEGRRRKSDLPWRKAYPHEWESPAVQGLTPQQKLVWEFLCHGPQTNRIGYYHWKPKHAAVTLGIRAEELGGDFRAVIEALGWRFDPKASVVWNPTFFRHNSPDNEDHAAGNVRDLEAVPRSVLDTEFLNHTKFLKPSVVHAFQQAVRRVLAADGCEPAPQCWNLPFEHVQQAVWHYYDRWLANANAQAPSAAERLANHYSFSVGIVKGLVEPPIDEGRQALGLFRTLLERFDESTALRLIEAFIDDDYAWSFDYWPPKLPMMIDQLMADIGIGPEPKERFVLGGAWTPQTDLSVLRALPNWGHGEAHPDRDRAPNSASHQKQDNE